MKKLALTSLLALSAIQGAEPAPSLLESQIAAIQKAKAERTPTERKLDSKLLMLCREACGEEPIPGAPKMRSNLETRKDGCVLVDLSAVPSPALTAAVKKLDGEVIYESPRWESVRVAVPPAALVTLAGRRDIRRISRTTEPAAHTGSVTSQGDRAHRADVARTDFGVDGTGVTVGVISDSADFSANAITLRDLPANFRVLPGRAGSGSGEGTAMSEIVHDLAPGANIIFASAVGGKAFFADSILMLREAGCDVIVDDISFPNEWQFQDDEIGRAVNSVVESGAVYLSSSGNEGSLNRGNSTTWEGDFLDGGADALLPGGTVHSFGTQNFNSMVSTGSEVVLQWSDNYTSSANDYDIYVLNAAGTEVVDSGTDTQDGDDEPIEFARAEPGQRIVIFKTDSAAPRYVRISCTGGPIAIQTAGQTIGHAGTANCICVAATDANEAFPNAFTTASRVEDSSSDGPHRMFYNPDGSAMTPGNFLASTNGGNVIPTPAITGADGGVTSLPAGGLNPFFGTSAAAPHCAAIAALVKSKRPSMTNAQIRAVLESSTLDIEAAGFDVNSGNGILMPELALTQVLLPQEVWRQENFQTFLPTGVAAPSFDADGDGLANILEYALGSPPRSPSPAPFTMVAKGGTTFNLNYTRNALATDVQLVFESNPTLALNAWQPVTLASDEVVTTTGNQQIRAASLPVGEQQRNFFRIRVTAQ